ncbi:hypothetical protein E3J48_02495 [Candidatus Aerophobetes bacterium]|uniref:Uncharacterized protein n=1 Tax=Aerophobetes bacterium TaxID=2030807 RepID=A0A523W987_UNCAE|nr:MAG: hypothetical protein E3J48_02495 [Candidatus Aerophobetes bacterium]
MDGVYVTDGYGGSHGEENVHSDNGTANEYDLADKVKFPELSDPYLDSEGVAYEYPIGNPLTYLDYLDHCALYIADNQIPDNEISPDTGDFDLISLGYFDPVINDTTQSKISWHWDEEEGKGILEVEGVVWVEAASLDLGKKKEMIEYRGNGIIVVGQVVDGTHIQGDIRVSANLVAEGSYVPGGEGGFPNNVLGLIAQNIYLAPDPCDSMLTMTGAFYAENQIVSRKQNEIAGTFVCKEFNISGQVPRIYQVPELANNLPPGIPGGTPIWSISTSQWSES